MVEVSVEIFYKTLESLYTDDSLASGIAAFLGHLAQINAAIMSCTDSPWQGTSSD
jgi:hypothetical protein